MKVRPTSSINRKSLILNQYHEQVIS